MTSITDAYNNGMRESGLPAKSMESIYSANSSKMLSGTHRRRMPGGQRQSGMVMACHSGPVSEIRQRVVSARLLRMKGLQNQLNDAQNHIVELSNENRVLRTLHKRQDSALSKYESSNAELPQLLHSHAEEIRRWQQKYRDLQTKNKEMNFKMKQKDAIILSLTDKNKRLMLLSQDKNLEEREKLAERLRYLEIRLMEKDEEQKMLIRRIQLDTKNFKSQLNAEHSKYKDLNQKYERVLTSEDRSKTTLTSRSLRQTNVRRKGKETKLNQELNTESQSSSSLQSLRDASPPKNHNNPTSSGTNKIKTPVQISNEHKSEPQENGYGPFDDDAKESDYDKRCKVALSIRNGMYTYDDRTTHHMLNGITEEDNPHNDEYYNDEAYDNDELSDIDNDGDRMEKDKYEDTKMKVQNYNKQRRDLASREISNGLEKLSINSKQYDHTLDMERMQQDIENDVYEKESFLDKICYDTIEDNRSILDPKGLDTYTLPNCPEKVSTESKRKNIDPSKKSKLLAALKAIDTNQSYDE